MREGDRACSILGTKYPLSIRSEGEPRGEPKLGASLKLGGEGGTIWRTQVNRRYKASSAHKWLKMLISHDQNGMRARQEMTPCSCVDAAPPAHRRLLSRSMDLKVNLVILSVAPRGESEPRGEPIGGQREDRRGSESQSVMDWIGPARAGDTEPTRKGGVQTSAWCGGTRDLARSLQGVS